MPNMNAKDLQCGVGNTVISITPTGDIKLCPMADPNDFPIANIFNDDLYKILSKYPILRIKDPKPELCGDCEHVNFCGNCVVRGLKKYHEMGNKCSWGKNINLPSVLEGQEIVVEVVLTLENIHKFYGDFEALKGISFEIKEGQIFGYLGPNGSGKTTTIKLLLGLIRPSSGNVYILGEDPYPDNIEAKNVRQHIGSMLEFNSLYENLTGLENIAFWANLYGINGQTALKKAKNVIEMVKLSEWGNTSVSKYSYGMNKRLVLARALVSDPDILILDEPTAGVDPESRYIIRNMMKKLAKQGKTIFFSSHDLEEVQKVCTHVALLKKGKLISEGVLNEIITEFGNSRTFVLLESPTDARYVAKKIQNITYDLKNRRTFDLILFRR
jgi:ABC-2 type transport system ATP-binding protein